MPELFSPLTVAGRTLANRIVLAPRPSGLAGSDGFASAELAANLGRIARGGAGLLVSEPLLVRPPEGDADAHLGAYADAFVPGLRQLATAVQAHHAPILFALDAPVGSGSPTSAELESLAESYILAARRALAAGADGVMLTLADGGLLHQLLSPLHNHRQDAFGGDLANRSRLPLLIVEGIRRWLGRRLLLGVRMVADELAPGGMNLQDARVVAKRLIAAGVQLLDVAAPRETCQVARFPGWAVPLASGMRRVVDVPVIGSGLLGDPLLADSVIRDGSVDLVMLGSALHANPDWPQQARERLASERRAQVGS